VDEGKIRAIGLSNESVWGAARWLHLAETLGLPRMASGAERIQPAVPPVRHRLGRVLDDRGHAAAGLLAAGDGPSVGQIRRRRDTRGHAPEHTPDLGGRITPRVFPAVAAYLGMAARHGLDPCQMAIAFCRARPFPTIPIIGATSLAQLQTNIGAAGLVLSAEVLAEIAAGAS
jgi:aryl-alcohol dehydrogenase-like predicted oxidoreductase